MRDLFVTFAVFGSIPYILRFPFLGILMWSWLGYMNPHKLSWGFAANFPFAQVVALATMGAILIAKDIRKTIPWNRESILLLVFVFWMFLSTVFSMYPDLAWQQWNKVWKIQLFTFLTMMLIDSRQKVMWLLWIICLSIGLYGVKGGIFTILSGGGYHVYGPTGTFIGGNNEIGLAMIMTMPWMRYFQVVAREKWQKVSMTIALLLTTVATLGTQSRGALVGMSVMFTMMFMKSAKNIVFLFVIAGFLVLAIQFMPESWHERMASTSNYEQDASALGRINAWWTAFYVALDKPFLGGGFEVFQFATYRIYAPDPDRVHDVHSIYFEVMGEHGFVGLGMALLLGLFALLSSRTIIKQTKGRDELKWLHELAKMMQVSVIGYAATGTFLGLAYFDLYYALIAIIVVCKSFLATGEFDRPDPGTQYMDKLPKIIKPPGL